MDIKQTVDLTYSKVDEINEKVNRVLNKSGSSNSSNVETKINENSTKLTEIETKIDNFTSNFTESDDKIDEITTKATTIGEDTTLIKADVSEIKTNVETIVTQTENLETMNNNITTINSNTATTNNNVITIKKDVESIKTSLTDTYYDNKLERTLDMIIDYINTQENRQLFQTDPYALDLPYSERLLENRNPTNEDYYSIDEEFESKNDSAFFIGLVYCAGTTVSFKYTMSFTCTESTEFTIIISKRNTQILNFEAGTHQYTLELSDFNIQNNMVVFHFRNSKGTITVHNIQFELSGEQVLFLNRYRKYHLSYSPGKIVVNKFENFKGYHLVLENIETLSPDMINRPYTLAAEKVVSYGMNYLMYYILDGYVPYGEVRTSVLLSHRFTADYKDGYYSKILQTYLPMVQSTMGYFMDGKVKEGSILATYGGTTNCGSLITSYNSSTYGSVNNSINYVSCVLIADLNRFDMVNRYQFIFEDFTGYNYLYVNSSTKVNVGFGKNATAFWDTENDKKVHIYLNDNGYCVKKEYLIDDDNMGAELLSQKIIGTYDYYYETNSDVYFVVKNGELLMFKKS